MTQRWNPKNFTHKEWLHEPEYMDMEGKGYHLVAWRHKELGMLNGYVGVDSTHPWHGLDYEDSALQDVFVHGGLTFAGPNFKEGYWYFGFDTAHAWDVVPGIQETLQLFKESEALADTPSLTLEKLLNPDRGTRRMIDMPERTYKNIEFVFSEVQALYQQIHEVKVQASSKMPSTRTRTREEKLNTSINHKRLYRKLHQEKMRKRKENAL